MLDSLAKHLEVLLSGKRVPLSKISFRDRKKIQSLLEAGVIEEKRSGSGRSLELRDHDALQVYALKEYPSGLDGQSARHASPRNQAIAQLRDSKKAVITDAEILQLRAGSQTDVLSRGGKFLPLVEWCRVANVAAIRLDDLYHWEGSGTISVVENLEVFLHFEKLGVETDLIYYAAGRLSERVLAWLSSPGLQTCRIIHFGDYDPVGVDEYLRLKRACPGRVKMFVPDDLESLLLQYGKADLLESSKSVLMRLRKEKDETASKIILLMDRYNCGLEQEILLSS